MRTASKAVILILFCSFSWAAQGQSQKSFSEDPDVFIQEVADLYKGISNSKIRLEVELVLNDFYTAWDSSYFSQDERAMVIQNANLLLKRRLQPYPYLIRYFYIIEKLKNGPDPFAGISWLNSLRDEEKESSLRQLQEYIDLFYDFLSEKVLNKSTSFTWQVSDTNYLLVYDTLARFVYKKTDLTCFTNNDTSVIVSTSGIYYPTLSIWDGSGGTVSWKRNRLDPDSVFAKLRDYKVNLKFSYYSADSVIFYNYRFFDQPLYGSFEEKVLSSPPGSMTSYPRFSSYLKNYEIRSLFKDIHYRGGFSMEGARLIGSGERFENASLVINHGDKLAMVIHSNAFYIEGEELSCNPASVILYLDNDSLFHPGLQMKYNDTERKVTLLRPGEGLAQSPFFNTYHRVNMNCNAMSWGIDSDSVNFETIRGVNRNSAVEFTSDNFFAMYDFLRLQGIDDKNPLYVIRSFSNSYSTNLVTPEFLASYMNKPVEQAKAMLLRLSIQGFLFYDQVNDRAVIQDKLHHFINASSGNKDYDVIRISSETFNEPNATLDLTSYDLLIRGVSEVLVSDSQQVYIYPDRKEIVMKKNRDFLFTGSVKAGLFEFFANECSFEYDSFRLNLPTVDYMSFSVKSFTRDTYGQYPLRKVNSVIEDVGGRILIDHPSNKSGLKPFPMFPIFISDKDSYVYYDKIGPYPRDTFRYTIYPYDIDSLDNFLTDNLEFKGNLESAGIFPVIDQPLKVQPDYSLGFVSSTPEEGYPVYGGKGIFYKDIFLSNKGLLGQGELDYLTSRSISGSFRFQPDRMVAPLVDDFALEAVASGVEYPDIIADTVSISWYPHADTMLLAQADGPFHLYDSTVHLKGGLTLTPEALTGKGTVSYEYTRMVANRFYFNYQTFRSDTVDFTLLEEDSGETALTADNYRTLVDLNERIVSFQANQSGSIVGFPYNNFISSMDNIQWYMDQDELLLTNDLEAEMPDLRSKTREELIDINLEGSEFIATNPDMDSLKFTALKARYDMNKYFIFAEEVMLLRVADAAIFPDSGYIRIYEGGKLETLKNAEIIADTLTKVHHIIDAEIDILSRNSYEGSGTYLFSSPDLAVQEIKMPEIWVDSTGITRSRGRIPEKDEFEINPYFAFTGNVALFANDPMLDFEGGFRIFQDCYQKRREDWVYFHKRLDPADVRIPLENPLRTVGGDVLETSLFISEYEEGIYPVIFENRKLSDDIIMFKAFGTISYDTVTDTYRIFEGEGPGPEAGERYFHLNRQACKVETFGQIDLGLDFGYVDILSYGQVDYLIVPDSANFNMTLVLDWFFDDNLMNMMSDSITVADLEGIDIAGPEYTATLVQLLGKDKAAELKQDMAVYGTMRRLPEELLHTIILTNVNMTWNPATSSYISKGPIGIMSIGPNVVNRYVNGYLELIKRRASDVLTLYLEVSPSQYYFFDYRADIMQSLATDIKYNERLEGIKAEKRTTTRPKAEFPYEYTISTRRKVVEFLRRMEEE